MVASLNLNLVRDQKKSFFYEALKTKRRGSGDQQTGRGSGRALWWKARIDVRVPGLQHCAEKIFFLPVVRIVC